jgi:hypothetical protein
VAGADSAKPRHRAQGLRSISPGHPHGHGFQQSRSDPLKPRALTGFVENPAIALRERGSLVVVASLHRPLGGCIAKQRSCRATTATTATMQRSWDRQGQTPTCSAIVAIVASLHRCMQRCNDRSLHVTMQRPGDRQRQLGRQQNPAGQAPDRGFLPSRADPFLLQRRKEMP